MKTAHFTLKQAQKWAVLIIAPFIITACATAPVNKDYSELRFPKPTFKHQVSFTCNDAALCSMLTAKFTESNEYIISNVNNIEMLNIHADLAAKSIATLQTKPQFFGRLKRQVLPVEIRVDYQLMDRLGNIQTSGYTSIDTETKTHIYPQVKAQMGDIPQSAWLTLVENLHADLHTTLSQTKWQTVVTAHAPDGVHFSVSATKASGLRINSFLADESDRAKRFQVITFERDRQGVERAILKPVSGFPPPLGSALITVSKSSSAINRK